MTNEQREMTMEEVLINNLANRVGNLIAQNEYLQLQLNEAQRQLAAQQQSTNGEHEGAVHESQHDGASSQRP